MPMHPRTEDMRMKRLRRWLLRLVILAVIAIVAILIGGKLYLATPQGGARVAARLSEVLGDRLTIAGVDAGLTASTIRDLQVFEAGPDAPAEPWVSVPRIVADLPLLSAVRGELPTALTLYDASVLLRFDRAGRLLTRFPSTSSPGGQLPPIRLERARVMLRQEGRPDFDFTNITADLTSVGDMLRLTGTAADPVLGDWIIAGALDPRVESMLSLKTRGIHFTPALLKSLPFIPPATWEQIQADGITPVELTVRFDARTDQVHYEAVLTPERLNAQVTAIHLPLEQGHGRIIIADGLVHLHDVRGYTAGGTLTVAGTLDFRADANLLDLGVRMERLQMRQLPPQWALPDWLEGQLRGQASLRMHITDKVVQVRGHGDATLRNVKLAGLSAAPIALRLRDDTLAADVALHDADLTPILQTFAVTVPIAGRANVNAALAIPLDTARDWTTYRLHGDVRLPWLQVAGMELVQVQSRLSAEQGSLRLPDLQAILALGENQTRLTGAADIGLSAPFGWTAQLALPAAELQLPVPSGHTLGAAIQGDGRLHGSLKPLTLAATGSIRADDVRLGEQDMGQLTARWEADLDRLRVLDVKLTDGKAVVTGSATLPLRPEGSGDLSLQFTDVESSDVAREIPGVRLPVQGAVSGTLQARLGAATANQSRSLAASLTLQAHRLRLGAVTVNRAAGHVEFANGQVDYLLQAETLGGQALLSGEGRTGRLRLQGARLSRGRQFLNIPVGRQGLHGTLDLDVAYQADGADQVLSGSGRFVLSRLRWLDSVLSERIQGEIVIAGSMVRVRNFNGSLAGGIVGGEIGYHLEQPQRRWLRISLQGADVPRLLAAWPDLADATDGTLDLRLRANLGREWHGTAEVMVQRGQLFGAELTELRLPVDFTYSPETARGQVEVPEGHGQLARGRVQGQASLRWGDETRLDGSVRFFGIQLHPLLRGMPDVSQRVDNGDLAGRLDFAASNLQSLDDLTATLDATLRNGQVLDLPVLRQLAPFIAPGRSLTAFSAGELRARLTRSIVRVEKLQLTGNVAQALIDGTMTLNGRLALEVTANPGLPGGDLPVLRQLGLRLPSTGPLPVGIVNQASRILTGRLIRLRIGGTVRNPLVQVVPLGVLNGDVLRPFLNWAAR